MSISPLAIGSPGSGADDPSGPPMGAQDMGSLYRPPRGLRPQLGIGAVNRTPSAAAKNRMVLTGQPKSPLTLSQPMQAVNPSTQAPQEPQGKISGSLCMAKLVKWSFFNTFLVQLNASYAH